MTAPIPDLTVPDRWLIGSQVVDRVHHPDRCQGRPCVIHHPSDHHMRSWPLLWRDDGGFMERVCRHGIGHGDPDDPKGRSRLHACDGCCWPDKAWRRLIDAVDHEADLTPCARCHHPRADHDLDDTRCEHHRWHLLRCSCDRWEKP